MYVPASPAVMLAKSAPRSDLITNEYSKIFSITRVYAVLRAEHYRGSPDVCPCQPCRDAGEKCAQERLDYKRIFKNILHYSCLCSTTCGTLPWVTSCMGHPYILRSSSVILLWG